MNYFVSIAKSSYHLWQVELLIENFKMLKLEDSLTIAIAETKEEICCPFYENLKNHKKVFVHEKQKCDYANRIYSLHLALTNKVTSLPVTILHPDMVLVNPIYSDYDITFQLDNSFQKEDDADLNNLLVKIQKAKNLEINWINLGDTICINRAPEDFFKRIISLTDFWTRNKNWQNPEKISWVITLLEYFGHISYYGTFEIESQLVDKSLKNVINYKRGLPPVFNKKMFKFEPSMLFNMGNPYEIITENNINKNTEYLAKIVSSYKAKLSPKEVDVG